MKIFLWKRSGRRKNLTPNIARQYLNHAYLFLLFSLVEDAFKNPMPSTKPPRTISVYPLLEEKNMPFTLLRYDGLAQPRSELDAIFAYSGHAGIVKTWKAAPVFEHCQTDR